MQAEIICIGDELLIGQVVNTNAAWLGRELAGTGIHVARITCVPDDHDSIVQEVRQAMSRVSWVFMTGGLGPTKDDITKLALIDVFGGKLEFSQETWDQLVKIYAMFGRQASEEHRDQAMQPSSARILANVMGTAPGLYFETGTCRVFAMPGIPYEMEYLMVQKIIPLIEQSNVGNAVLYRTVATVGQGETVLAEMIRDIEEGLPEGFKLAYLPSVGKVRIRITGVGRDRRFVQDRVDFLANEIATRLSEYVFATDDISLAKAIGQRLEKHGEMVSVAESCTGGFLSHLFTSDPGSSAYFQGGAITYSNTLKELVLGVRRETLDSYGAVSEQTVSEMAEGAREKFQTEFSIAVSGIAGPGGGTNEKPVGTVWIAVADHHATVAKEFRFGKDRLRNIELSAVRSLDMLRQLVWSKLLS